MRGEWVRPPAGDTSVIFVHGFLSSGESCWTNKNGTNWPRLLAAEPSLDAIGIYVFTYQTDFFSGGYRLSDVVDSLKEHLRTDHASESRRLIFICHSMGGVIVRKFVVERAPEFIEAQKQIGIYLIASPSLGSELANWLSPLARILGHRQAEVLTFIRGNQWLSDLNREFKNLQESGRLRIRGKELIEDKFVILRSLIRAQVVEPLSGAYFFSDSYKVPDSDHFTIAKPEDHKAIQHRILCDFVRSFLTDDTDQGFPETKDLRRQTPESNLHSTDRGIDQQSAGQAVERQQYNHPSGLRSVADEDRGREAESSIPIAPERNFGREEKANVLASLCTSPGGATIIVLGGPGLGKTTLTLAVSTQPQVVTAFGQRRWFVRLDAAKDIQLFRATIAAAVGLPHGAAFSSVVAELKSVPGLIILDNLETPWEADSDAVEQTLRQLAGISGLVILASIRGTMEPKGARWHQVHLRALTEVESRRLFLEIAQQVDPEDPDLPDFLRALGGVPLAIELIARRVGNRGQLSDLWHQWQKTGVALAARIGHKPNRLNSLPISIELSLHSPRLSDDGKRLFALLGQLPAGIAPSDRDLLIGDSGSRGADELLAVGLGIEYRDRLDLLPPIRDHARRFYAPTTQDRKRWAEHFLALVQFWGMKVGTEEGDVALRRLVPESGNLEAAIACAGEDDLWAEAVAAMPGFARFVRLSGSSSARPIHDLALTLQAQGRKEGAAAAFAAFGSVAYLRSFHEIGMAACEKGLKLYRELRDESGQAECLRVMADIALDRSEYESAEKKYDLARLLFRRLGNVLGVANCLSGQALIALERVQYRRSQVLFKRAYKLHKQLDNLLGKANCLFRLGELGRLESRPASARTYYEQARELYRMASVPLGIANCTKAVGDVALSTGDISGAKAAFCEAQSHFRQLGVLINEGNAFRGIGDADELEGDVRSARKNWRLALRLYQHVPELNNVGSIYWRLARISTGKQRARHCASAKRVWLSIERPDLVEEMITPLIVLQRSEPDS